MLCPAQDERHPLDEAADGVLDAAEVGHAQGLGARGVGNREALLGEALEGARYFTRGHGAICRWKSNTDGNDSSRPRTQNGRRLDARSVEVVSDLDTATVASQA